MLERTICIILAALLTGCGAASPGAGVNGAEANEPPGGLEERYIYDGEVAIEPVAMAPDALGRAASGSMGASSTPRKTSGVSATTRSSRKKSERTWPSSADL